ncbi:two-component system, NtrC family, response regulator [Methylomarinovum tepidoasis]|uniref:Two-component system, NtrC family, response regulator n=1 Tax=Methylomarinovum tepidoasis TaxID=2840183 RepID=A0AAU9CJR6_9GAMM|nr:PEP-CTERM-box response regulator transcription factor [Methylomarinovum sp. IN45]BCX87862.1 two-component system, NtrC family, response regulator [Methylomarinovum sp. IN45]
MSDFTLLIVEDDPGLQSQLKWNFADRYKVVTASDRESALAVVKKRPPAVVTLDLGLPPDPGGVSEGFATLEAILRHSPNTKVIVITGNDQVDNAVRAIGMGAYDFYQKPVEPDMLAFVVERAMRLYELEEENRKLARSQVNHPLDGVIAASPRMVEICRLLERLAATDLSVLLLGESGTGKEVMARALHNLSRRREGPFIAINTAAIPETLLEAELFGYEKGAFTDAAKQTIGKIEMAGGGTLFLDEIGDMPPSLQPKLLRFLQERTIERIGGRKPIPVDVRIVCATNQDLEALIAQGKFRQDLYFRINESVIELPPLRERREDIAVLARAFLHRYNHEMKRDLLDFDESALAALEAYDWPGNVRELQGRVKTAVALAQGPKIRAEDLKLSPPETTRRLLTLKEAREEAERQALAAALSAADGKVAKAAEILDVTRPTLYALLDRHNLKVS